MTPLLRSCCMCGTAVLCALSLPSPATLAAEELLPPGVVTDGWALPELEQMALAASPRLQQAGAATEVAQGRRIAASARPNPTISYDAGSIGAGGTAGTHGVFIDQEIVRGGKQTLAQAAGQYEVQRRQWQVNAEQLRVLNDVRKRYFELLALQRRTELEAHLVEEAQRVLSRAQELQKDDSDEVEEPDILLARGALRRRKLDLRDAHSRYLAAWEQLITVLGQPHAAPMPLAGSLEAGLEIGKEAEEAWWELTREHPEVEAARLEVQRRQASLQLARARSLPNVTLRAGVDYDFDSDETLGRVRLSVPLQSTVRNQGEVLEAEAQLRNAMLDVDRREMELRGRLAEALQRRQRFATIVEEYARELLPEARDAYERYLERFELEESSFSRVTTAQDNYIDAQTRYLDSLLELRRVEVDLSTKLLRTRQTRSTVDID